MGNGWIEVIQNGIDCKLFHPDEVARARWRAAWGAQRDTLVIGRFGRYHALKGYAELVDAFAALPNRDRQLLVLGGRGVDQDNVELQRLIAAAGIASQVRLLGEIRGLHSVLPALDLFVSTSHGESFPNVVAEAMACGVPCVATAVGASAHVVGDAGWTVSPAAMKHLPAVIAHALRCVEQNPLIRRRAVTRIAEGFSMAAMVERYEAMFATLAVPS